MSSIPTLAYPGNPPAAPSDLIAAFARCTDVELAEMLIDLGTEKARMREEFHAREMILARAIRDRILANRAINPGAKAIPHPDYQIELIEEFTPYAYDIETLRRAAVGLPEDEAAKVVKFVPERVTVEPAHYAPGAAVSINALAKRYAGTEVGTLLANGMSRASLDEKLVCKKRAK